MEGLIGILVTVLIVALVLALVFGVIVYFLNRAIGEDPAAKEVDSYTEEINRLTREMNERRSNPKRFDSDNNVSASLVIWDTTGSGADILDAYVAASVFNNYTSGVDPVSDDAQVQSFGNGGSFGGGGASGSWDGPSSSSSSDSWSDSSSDSGGGDD